MNPKGRILVVDDDETLLRIAEKELGKAGYEVEVVLGGADARALLKEEVFDLVFTDLMLPGEDGVSLCRAIHKDNPKRPVVLMSSFNEEIEKHRKEFIQAGGYDQVLQKPLAPGILTGIAEKILKSKH